MAVTSYTADGHIAEMPRSSGVTESFLYSYLPAGNANAGLLSNVTPAGGSTPAPGPW